jgi:hypothetical protein
MSHRMLTVYPEDNMIVVDALNKDKYSRNITLKSTFKERVYIDGLRLPAELDGVIVFARTPTVAVLKYGDMWTFEVTIDPSVASLCCFGGLLPTHASRDISGERAVAGFCKDQCQRECN